MDEKETIWNKNLFSDTYKIENKNDDNFQTMNMIYKIKKIKKNRKPKLENYKNIETFETIQNNVNNKEDRKDRKDDENIIEGLKGRVTTDDPNFLGLPDSDFDGVDKPSKKSSSDPRLAITNFIEKVFKKIDNFNYKKAYIFAKAFSGKTPEKSDVLILKKYIGWFETILLSYFACYNWFFLMYYRYNHNDDVEPELFGYRVKTLKLDTYELQNQSFSRTDFWGMIYKFINYFFIFCLMFVEYLQNIMMEKIPNLCKIIFNLKGCFIIVFLLMLYFIQYWSTWLFNFLKDILTGNTNNYAVGAMYFILLLGYFFGTYNFGYITKTPGYTFHSFADFVTGFPFSLISAFLRFIVIMLISVPIGGILCVFYILYQSFFGILFNVGILEFFGFVSNSKSIFQKINEFIKDNNQSQKSPIKNILNFPFDNFIYNNALSIAFLIMFIFAIVDYNKFSPIKNSNLKINLNAITIVIMIIIFTTILANIYNDYKINEQFAPTLEKDVSEDDIGIMEEINKIIHNVSTELLKPILEEAKPIIDETTKAVSSVSNAAQAYSKNMESLGEANKNIGSLPGVPTSLPGMSGSIPGMSGSIPGMSGSIPGMSGSIPGMSGSIPGVPTSIPGVPTSIPGVPSSIPGVPSSVSAIPGISEIPTSKNIFKNIPKL